jgi:hypothetical protein
MRRAAPTEPLGCTIDSSQEARMDIPSGLAKLMLRLGLLVAITMLPVGAAEVNRSWEKLVETAQVGKSVVVKTMDSVQVEGKLLAISADSITVRLDRQPMVFAREAIFRVRYANIRRRHTLLGMAIGAGIGAVSFALSGRDNYRHDYGARALAGVVFGIGPGAAIGGAMPIGQPLYEASGGLKR